jgi:hypothetical protein
VSVAVVIACDVSECDEQLVLAHDGARHPSVQFSDLDATGDGEPMGYVDGQWTAEGWVYTDDGHHLCPKHGKDDELSRRRKGTVREAEESGFRPTSAERALVGQLRSDVEVERQGRHTAEDLLERAITSLRSIASADPKSEQARWMVEEAKRGFPKGAKR